MRLVGQPTDAVTDLNGYGFTCRCRRGLYGIKVMVYGCIHGDVRHRGNLSYSLVVIAFSNAPAMVNYVFCLAHFCEIHGPLTIICTRRCDHDTDADFAASLNQVLCASCELILPHNVTSLSTTTEEGKFLSTRYPTSQGAYAALKKLVMKSLSVETSAHPAKPVFIGDAINGYCLSRVFHIQDTYSRGGERKYSLVMACDSEVHVVENWGIISTYMGEIISLIQRLVELKLEREASVPNSTDNERFLRRSKIQPQSLVELTKDPDIFVKLHLWAMELLRDAMM